MDEKFETLVNTFPPLLRKTINVFLLIVFIPIIVIFLIVNIIFYISDTGNINYPLDKSKSPNIHILAPNKINYTDSKFDLIVYANNITSTTILTITNISNGVLAPNQTQVFTLTPDVYSSYAFTIMNVIDSENQMGIHFNISSQFKSETSNLLIPKESRASFMYRRFFVAGSDLNLLFMSTIAFVGLFFISSYYYARVLRLKKSFSLLRANASLYNKAQIQENIRYLTVWSKSLTEAENTFVSIINSIISKENIDFIKHKIETSRPLIDQFKNDLIYCIIFSRDDPLIQLIQKFYQLNDIQKNILQNHLDKHPLNHPMDQESMYHPFVLGHEYRELDDQVLIKERSDKVTNIKYNNIIIITSDLAGSGKTTILNAIKNIHYKDTYFINIDGDSIDSADNIILSLINHIFPKLIKQRKEFLSHDALVSVFILDRMNQNEKIHNFVNSLRNHVLYKEIRNESYKSSLDHKIIYKSINTLLNELIPSRNIGFILDNADSNKLRFFMKSINEYMKIDPKKILATSDVSVNEDQDITNIQISWTQEELLGILDYRIDKSGYHVQEDVKFSLAKAATTPRCFWALWHLLIDASQGNTVDTQYSKITQEHWDIIAPIINYFINNNPKDVLWSIEDHYKPVKQLMDELSNNQPWTLAHAQQVIQRIERKTL